MRPKIKCCLINNINSDYQTKNNQKKNCINIKNSYNFVTIEKKSTTPKLFAPFKPKLNVNPKYRITHIQNFDSEIQFLNRTTDKILSSENSSKLVFKPKYYRSIFLNNNIIYNSIKDNLKNDQETNLIHSVNNSSHRKKNKTFNSLNYGEKLNGKIYHRLFE